MSEQSALVEGARSLAAIAASVRQRRKSDHIAFRRGASAEQQMARRAGIGAELAAACAQSQAMRERPEIPFGKRIAGASARSRPKRPCASRIAAQASTAPGTVTAWIESGILRVPCASSASSDARAPARPQPL